ncbi:DUF2079 domain-containing protein [Streptomyces sp. DSM 41634]|uniref:DUF2079 domain-containing protein n=1 Tax=Streptomyces sp. DSM 41634 TaxID=3448656 RepID=UPI002888ACEC|nr:DUF2079 domain-containing protein [Streptomyces sp. DSM 41633]
MQAPTGNTAAVLPQQSGTEEQAAREPAAGSGPGATWWIWAMAGALFFAYTALSLRIHEHLLSHSFDLGIFVQVVRSYADGHLPVSEIKGPDFPVLGDHFSPVLAVLAPLYWLWPSVKLLLVAQAALIAASVLPLAFWARRTLGSTTAVVIGACYAVSWGIASGVAYDFHEWAFAVPLLAFSLTALADGRLRAAAYWALPLVLVKEDLGLTVAVIGLVIAWRGGRGGRRLGIVTAAAGLAASALAVLTLASFHPGGFDGYFASHNPGGGAGSGSDGGLVELLHQGTLGLITPQEKVTTLILMLAPTLFLALRSPLLLIALPTVLWRLASDYPAHWGTSYHYGLLIMPIVFAAFIDALHRRGASGRSLYRYLAGSAAVTLLLLPHFPLWQLVQPATWRTDPRSSVARRVMAEIPDGATVQASNNLGPHLADRTSVSVYGWGDSRRNPEWIMVDTKVAPNHRWPMSVRQELVALDFARMRGYRTVKEKDGFVLLSRTR